MYLSISRHVNAKWICLCVFLLVWTVVMILVAASAFIVFQFLLHPSAQFDQISTKNKWSYVSMQRLELATPIDWTGLQWMSLGQFFPTCTSEIISPFSVCRLFGSIPKLVPLEQFEEVSSCFEIAKKLWKDILTQQVSRNDIYYLINTPGAKIHVNTM